ncbi:T9SS type A sorting domain-containing protein [Paracrocinitomix mangrovi]|uniref:T9SS type A sorting domain-containing protein n=1 Tax=Paracrocinitomix mangrovi TaxID=2862509 RepID=UPI001C8D556F|nr:T9SS type A sorting domain-containing protein [Paracrocinitomix mangrovi]UKN01725.1 T9SS type A sorting domain-containing protein [Paracrocinitomix mangrovi]
MKKSILLLASIPVALVSAYFFVGNVSEADGNYSPRLSSHVNHYSNGSDGMLEYYHRLKGDYTQEDYLRAKDEMSLLPSNRATVTWNEHGPDNVGGRTRAILIDKNDINHVYAGSVSGGLFESISRANFWTPITLFSENLAISSMCQTADGTIYIATGHNAETSSGSQNAYDTGGNGDGMYKLVRNTDGETTDVIKLTNLSASVTTINEIVCDTITNQVWVATNQGLKLYNPGDDSFTDISNGLSLGGCTALAMSKDGSVMIAAVSSPIKTHVSYDGGASFIDVTSSANSGSPIPIGTGRVEYAISHERGTNGNYYVYAVRASPYLAGVWMSSNNGLDWTQTAPPNNQQPGSFSPFSTGGGSAQGLYDNIISVAKGNPEKMFLGGIDCYSWATTGNWTQLSQWFLAPQDPQYVHADQHEMVWDDLGRLYIGNDGGVHFSDDGGQTFHPANRGFNVTQFYAIGASAHGDVIGGAQDNGTQANYHNNSTWHEFDEVGGGDGFSCEISFINRDILFSSVYHGAVRRSADRGQNSNSFVPDEFSPAGIGSLGCSPGATSGGCGQFFTNFKLWENPNDLNSTDSIHFVPSEAYQIGDIVQVPSKTTQTYIQYTCPINVNYEDTVNYNGTITGADTVITSIAPSNDYNLSVFAYTFVYGAPALDPGDTVYLSDLDTNIVIESVSTIPHYYATNAGAPGDTLDMGNDSIAFNISWDTLIVQDPYQSWFAVGLGRGQGVWMTRNALRFSAPAEDWFLVNHVPIPGAGSSNPSAGQVSAMEFSRDGDNLFVGTWDGLLFRLSGFGDVYSPEKGVDTLIDADLVSNVANLQTTWTQIGSFGSPVTGIAVEGDLTHVVVTLGYYTSSANGKVQETTDALGSSPTWSNMGLSNNLPCYSVVIDRDDPNVVVVGTDMGTYVTEDGGNNWENCSGIFGNVPVFDMKQNWRTWDEGNLKPGEIYIGTHGRGIWSTEAYLSLPHQQDNLEAKKFTSNIKVYPNPMRDQGTIAFELENSSNVEVKIFNLSGQVVRTINETNVAAGQNKIEFGVEDLPSGSYIIRLTAGTMVETNKFIKY